VQSVTGRATHRDHVAIVDLAVVQRDLTALIDLAPVSLAAQVMQPPYLQP
jgi:hypothetical protein